MPRRLRPSAPWKWSTQELQRPSSGYRDGVGGGLLQTVVRQRQSGWAAAFVGGSRRFTTGSKPVVDLDTLIEPNAEPHNKVKAAMKKQEQATRLHSPGEILPNVLYRADEFKRRMGWSDSAFRAARRRGLVVRREGKRAYVWGDDAIAYMMRDRD